MKLPVCSITRPATTATSLVLILIAFACGTVTSAYAAAPKPISKVPYTITKPGRYVLSKDLVLKSTATAAITINADDVTLDLAGHVMSHSLPAGTDVTGILADTRGGIAVLNGTVRGFSTGVRLNSNQANVSGVSVENVRVDASTTSGIELLGATVSVKHCVVVNTGSAQAPFAYGMSVDAVFATVIDNDILSTLAMPGSQSEGIHGGAQVGVFENNRVLNEQSARGSTGMFLGLSASYLVENNRIAGFATGIRFTSASPPKYRNNFTTDCTTPYVSGTDSGNNK